VHLVARRSIEWRTPERDLCTGSRRPWLDRLPYAFHRLPRRVKDRYNRSYRSGVSESLRERIIGKVSLHERRSILAIAAKVGGAVATLSDGSTLKADHVIVATGFRVDLDRLSILEPSLRRAIRTDAGSPLLTPWFESSVRGLYFCGLTSARTVGPMYRFVAGGGPAARPRASAIARRRCVRAS